MLTSDEKSFEARFVERKKNLINTQGFPLIEKRKCQSVRMTSMSSNFLFQDPLAVLQTSVTTPLKSFCLFISALPIVTILVK